MPENQISVDPWDNEPSILTWVDPHTRLRCLIKRHPSMLHLCGYVRIPYSHRLYKATKHRLERDLNPHGGVTFDQVFKAKTSRFNSRGRWVGFDCAHAGDLAPGLVALVKKSHEQFPGLAPPSFMFSGDVYRDIHYVIGVVTLLAEEIGGTRHGV